MANKTYLDVNQLCQMYGGCSAITIERLIREDLDFPKPLRIGPTGRRRLFDAEEIAQYNDACAERGRKTAIAKKVKAASDT
jgi:predicted DNA-binding transcriptional regulator AlpA